MGVNGWDQRMQSDCAQRTMTDHMNRIISKNRKAEKKLGLLEKSGCGAPFLKQNLEAARRHKRLFS
jgi:hypothetical protein